MTTSLQDIAHAMAAPGKGLLAADESSGTIKKRFDVIGVDSTQENRRDSRERLFRTAPAMADLISGVILFDETIRQKAADGTPLVKIIQDAGSIPGIKVDMGAKDLPRSNGEKVTEGLDGLRARLAEYFELGARFAKWRAVIDIGRGGNRSVPSAYCIHANTHALARYAALCQEAGIVPIVEPEVLMDGDHDAERCYQVTQATLKALYSELYEQRVSLEGTILKPNMIVSGKLCPTKASPEEVAERTLKCFTHTVPAAVPGIVFLSGGQSDIDATANLNAINQLKSASSEVYPWAFSFSYGRALQTAPLDAWRGKAANVTAGQKAFAHRARMNGLAATGAWTPEMET